MTFLSKALARTLSVLALLAWCGCGKSDRGNAPEARASGLETSELRYQGFAGIVTFPELAEDLGYLAPLKLNYVGNTISGPQDIQTVVSGDTDFGGAFNGAVLKLVAAKAPVRAVIGYYGIDDQTWTGFYVREDSPIKSARDLIGKKVAVNTVGAHYEFVLREYLAKSGLTKSEAGQVTLVVMPPVTSEQALRQGQVDAAALGNVFRDKALTRGKLRRLFSDYELFGKFTAGSYVMSQAFLRDKPKTARKFVEATAKAIEWARAQPREQVIARYAQIVKRRARNEDASLTEYWLTTGVAGTGGLIAPREFQVWLDWLLKDGQLEQNQVNFADVYTNQLNPFWKIGPT